jgi:hypothetical protein
MVYYSQFPRAIHRLRADCVRVTHPCATDILLCPFDLHVLSLPLAFILSQDQTLHCIFLPVLRKEPILLYLVRVVLTLFIMSEILGHTQTFCSEELKNLLLCCSVLLPRVNELLVKLFA